MNPGDITDVSTLQQLLLASLNVQEEQQALIDELREQLSDALDEINRLKGEHSSPKFRGSSRKLKRGKKIKKLGKKQQDSDSKEASSSPAIEVDRSTIINTPPPDLPADSQFKGYRSVYQRDIRIERDYVEYRIARWYSPSEQKYYESSLADCYQGRVGNRLKSFIQILHHCGDMPHRRIAALLSHLGIDLSAGKISNLLSHSDWVEKERADLLESSLKHSPYLQIDSTRSKEKGQNVYTQILCGELFSLFYTQYGKGRLDVYAALQGKTRGEVLLAYNSFAKERLLASKSSKMHIEYFEQHLKQGQVLCIDQLHQIFEQEDIFKKTNQNRRSAIAGALAAGFYYQQSHFPKVGYLISDDAPEYKAIAQKNHMHCWIHAIRHYRLLSPSTQYFQELHEHFMDKLWLFYHRIKTYKELRGQELRREKQSILDEFDRLFCPSTDFRLLNKLIERTQMNRKYLLAFLEYPLFPLQNNRAERAARRIVRKRDISFHTWSKRGTRIRDAFISLEQTARKLKIDFFQYILDRNSKSYQIESMAKKLEKAYLINTSTS